MLQKMFMLLKCFYCPSVQKGKVNHIKHFPYSLIVSLQHFAALCTPSCDELSSPTIDMSSSNTPRLCMHCTTETSEVHPRRPRHLPLALRNKHNCDLSSSLYLSAPSWSKSRTISMSSLFVLIVYLLNNSFLMMLHKFLYCTIV